MNNLFRGISFSREDNIHEHIQESLLLGRGTKGNLAWYFYSFLKVFERGFLQKMVKVVPTEDLTQRLYVSYCYRILLGTSSCLAG